MKKTVSAAAGVPGDCNVGVGAVLRDHQQRQGCRNTTGNGHFCDFSLAVNGIVSCPAPSNPTRPWKGPCVSLSRAGVYGQQFSLWRCEKGIGSLFWAFFIWGVLYLGRSLFGAFLIWGAQDLGCSSCQAGAGYALRERQRHGCRCRAYRDGFTACPGRHNPRLRKLTAPSNSHNENCCCGSWLTHPGIRPFPLRQHPRVRIDAFSYGDIRA